MPLIILIGLGIFGLLLLSSRRQGVLDLIETLYNFIRGSFWKIVSLVIILLILAFLFGISWVGIWSAIGNWALSPKAGILIGVLSLAGIFISDEGGWIKRTCVALFAIIVFGFCFPTLKEALNRYSGGVQDEFSNVLNSITLKNKPAGVLSGVVTTNAVLYNDNGTATYTTLLKGQEIRTISSEKRQFGKSPETFANIMTRDRNGEFVNGACGWIAIEKLSFNGDYATPQQQAPHRQTTRSQDQPKRDIAYYINSMKNSPNGKTKKVSSEIERALVEVEKDMHKQESEYTPFFQAILSSTPIELDLPRGQWMTTEHISVETTSGGFQKLTPNIFTLTGEKTKVWISLTRGENKQVYFYYKKIY